MLEMQCISSQFGKRFVNLTIGGLPQAKEGGLKGAVEVVGIAGKKPSTLDQFSGATFCSRKTFTISILLFIPTKGIQCKAVSRSSPSYTVYFQICKLYPSKLKKTREETTSPEFAGIPRKSSNFKLELSNTGNPGKGLVLKSLKNIREKNPGIIAN